MIGKQFAKFRLDIARQANLRFGEPRQFLPEHGGVAQAIERDLAQPSMIFGQHEWPPALFQRVAVAFQNRVAGIARANGQMLCDGRRVRAGGEAHEVHGVGHRIHFVKVVDAPDQASFDVPPGPEIFQMKIAHGQERWRNRGLPGNLAPNLDPPVECRAQERKKPQRHLLMFERKGAAIQRDAGSHPLFITRCRLANIHAIRDTPRSVPSVANVSENESACPTGTNSQALDVLDCAGKWLDKPDERRPCRAVEISKICPDRWGMLAPRGLWPAVDGSL